MCSTKAENFSDESQHSFIDTEGLSEESLPSSVNSMEEEGERNVNLISSGESSESDSSSIIIPNQTKKKRYNDNRSEKPVKTPRLTNSECSSTVSNIRKVNYESVSSLSVSSSPERTRSSSSDTGHGKTSHPARRLASQPRYGEVDSSSSSLIVHSMTINHAEILSKMEQELREKGFQMDLNSNHHLFADFNKSRHQSRQIEACNEKKVPTQSQVSSKSKLSFGIDRILSDENASPETIHRRSTTKESGDESPPVTSEEPSYYQISKMSPNSDNNHFSIRHNNLSLHHHHHQHHHHRHHPHFHPNNASNPLAVARCTECYFLGRYCRNNGNLAYSPLLVNSSPGAVSGVVGGAATGGPNSGVSASFSHPWMSSSIYENSPLLSPSAYHPSTGLPSTYGLNTSNFSTMSSLVGCSSVSGGGRRKRSWSRAVFSSLQRKGLEKRFQIQKYITKPDRRQLAATLGLTDAQVKVWFQNRRMKFRHSKEGKVTSGIGDGISSTSSSTATGQSTSVNDKK